MLRAHDLAQTDQVIQDGFATRLPLMLSKHSTTKRAWLKHKAMTLTSGVARTEFIGWLRLQASNRDEQAQFHYCPASVSLEPLGVFKHVDNYARNIAHPYS